MGVVERSERKETPKPIKHGSQMHHMNGTVKFSKAEPYQYVTLASGALA